MFVKPSSAFVGMPVASSQLLGEREERRGRRGCCRRRGRARRRARARRRGRAPRRSASSATHGPPMSESPRRERRLGITRVRNLRRRFRTCAIACAASRFSPARASSTSRSATRTSSCIRPPPPSRVVDVGRRCATRCASRSRARRSRRLVPRGGRVDRSSSSPPRSRCPARRSIRDRRRSRPCSTSSRRSASRTSGRRSSSPAVSADGSGDASSSACCRLRRHALPRAASSSTTPRIPISSRSLSPTAPSARQSRARRDRLVVVVVVGRDGPPRRPGRAPRCVRRGDGPRAAARGLARSRPPARRPGSSALALEDALARQRRADRRLARARPSAPRRVASATTRTTPARSERIVSTRRSGACTRSCPAASRRGRPARPAVA